MPKEAKGIASAATVRTAKKGRHADGGGLYLFVRGPTARFWTFKWTL